MKRWLLIVLLGSASLFAQDKKATGESPHVLVVGLYHFANPGRDALNIKADDVLAPKRQGEIAQVIEVLKKYRPTKIAVESEAGGTKIAEEYPAYLAGKRELTRNETEQIGFRLAREIGMKQLYPIDSAADMDFDRIANFAKQHGQQQTLDASFARAQQQVGEVQRLVNTSTIIDVLKSQNDDQQVRQMQALYMDLAKIGGGGEYPGAEVVTGWYGRNLKIYKNLRDIIDSPNDRVLVLYGAGHLHWLQRDVLESGDLVLEYFRDYAK